MAGNSYGDMLFHSARNPYQAMVLPALGLLSSLILPPLHVLIVRKGLPVLHQLQPLIFLGASTFLQRRRQFGERLLHWYSALEKSPLLDTPHYRAHLPCKEQD